MLVLCTLEWRWLLLGEKEDSRWLRTGIKNSMNYCGLGKYMKEEF